MSVDRGREFRLGLGLLAARAVLVLSVNAVDAFLEGPAAKRGLRERPSALAADFGTTALSTLGHVLLGIGNRGVFGFRGLGFGCGGRFVHG